MDTTTFEYLLISIHISKDDFRIRSVIGALCGGIVGWSFGPVGILTGSIIGAYLLGIKESAEIQKALDMARKDISERYPNVTSKLEVDHLLETSYFASQEIKDVLGKYGLDF